MTPNQKLFPDSRPQKNTRHKQIEKAELKFKKIATEAGYSKKTVDEILKWYHNSKPNPKRLSNPTEV